MSNKGNGGCGVKTGQHWQDERGAERGSGEICWSSHRVKHVGNIQVTNKQKHVLLLSLLIVMKIVL